MNRQTYLLALGIIFLIISAYLLIWHMPEHFISYSARYSEYGPDPWMVLTKYINNDSPYSYSQELTRSLLLQEVMEIFPDQTYKTYGDDGFVREGRIPEKLWTRLLAVEKVAPEYVGKPVCVPDKSRELTRYNAMISGLNIDLGLMLPGCLPDALSPLAEAFQLMQFLPDRRLSYNPFPDRWAKK